MIKHNWAILYIIFLIITFFSCHEQRNEVIDFTLTSYNNIAVESILNLEDTVALMFHTAIGSVSLTPEMCQKLNTQKEKQSSNTTSWSGTGDVEYIQGNQLQIANLEWDSLTVWLNLLSGQETDGKFGPNLFGDKLIEINFDQSNIVLHDKDDQVSAVEGFQAFQLSTDEQESLFIEGELHIGDIKLTNKFMIHSGYGGSIILDDAFCEANPLIKTLSVIEEKDLKDSFGNIIKTKKVSCDQLRLMDATFDDIPISFFDSDLEIQKVSVLGGELLKRFNLILDQENMMLYAKPSTLAQESM